MARYSLADVRDTCKQRDAWWTVLLVDPLACRLVRLVANRTSLTPNQLTWAAFSLGLAAAACFAEASRLWLAAGAGLFYLSFLVDCMDGKLARLKGTGTVFGLWMDFILDRVRTVVCALALAFGQYSVEHRMPFIYLGIAVVVLDLFRYVDGPQIAKVWRAMRARIAQTIAELQEWQALVPYPRGDSVDETVVRLENLLRRCGPAEPEESVVSGQQPVDLHQRFRSRFPWYDSFRLTLARHRIRTHLVSGIEFQMTAFIVAPLLGPAMLIPAIAAVGALLVLFEAALIYKLWLSTKDFERLLAEATGVRQASPFAPPVPVRS